MRVSAGAEQLVVRVIKTNGVLYSQTRIKERGLGFVPGLSQLYFFIAASVFLALRGRRLLVANRQVHNRGSVSYDESDPYRSKNCFKHGVPFVLAGLPITTVRVGPSSSSRASCYPNTMRSIESKAGTGSCCRGTLGY